MLRPLSSHARIRANRYAILSPAVDAPPSTNIVAGALIMQIALVAILAVGLALYGVAGPDAKPRWVRKPWTLLVFASLCGFGPLILSEDVTSLGRALFGNRHLALFSLSLAIKTTMVVNLFVVAGLITSTGGTKGSPFTSALFALPVFSIFLWESYPVVLTHVALTCITAMLCNVNMRPWREKDDDELAFFFVAGAIMVLTSPHVE